MHKGLTAGLKIENQLAAEMGWTATTIPEEYGGLGMSHLELVVIAEELGRACAPVPFSSTVYLAAEAIMSLGTEAQKQAWLPKLADGSAIGCFALGEAGGAVTPDQISTSMADGVINGTKVPVADGGIADVAIVVCKSGGGDGATLALVDLSQEAVAKDKVQMIDFSRGHAELTFNGACAEVLGEEGAGWAAVESLMNSAAILFAWEQIGLADKALERHESTRWVVSLSVARLLLTRLSSTSWLKCTSRTRWRAVMPTTVHGHSMRARGSGGCGCNVACCGDSGIAFAAEENIQTHGGMGFTWEFDCQFYYRRAKL